MFPLLVVFSGKKKLYTKSPKKVHLKKNLPQKKDFTEKKLYKKVYKKMGTKIKRYLHQKSTKKSP